MLRSGLAWFAVALYGVAWFLPVIRDGHTLAEGVLPGWEAVKSAATATVEGYEDQMLLTALIRSTAWMNLVFVAAAGLVVSGRASARLLRTWAWALGVAAILNTHWLALALAESDLTALRAGYYAWLAAFPLLAVALWRGASVKHFR